MTASAATTAAPSTERPSAPVELTGWVAGLAGSDGLPGLPGLPTGELAGGPVVPLPVGVPAFVVAAAEVPGLVVAAPGRADALVRPGPEVPTDTAGGAVGPAPGPAVGPVVGRGFGAGAGAGLGAGLGGGGAAAGGGGAIPGRRPAPNAQPSTVPGRGLYEPAPTVL